MKLELTADIAPLQEMLTKLNKRELSGAMKNIGEAGVGLVRESFQTSTDPYGDKWKPLSDDYLDSTVPGTDRLRKSYGTAPLRRRGQLMSSFNYQVRGGSVEIGTPKAFAKFHQGDDSGGKGIIPRRAFLPVPSRGLPKKWQTEIIEAVEAFLEVD